MPSPRRTRSSGGSRHRASPVALTAVVGGDHSGPDLRRRSDTGWFELARMMSQATGAPPEVRSLKLTTSKMRRAARFGRPRRASFTLPGVPNYRARWLFQPVTSASALVVCAWRSWSRRGCRGRWLSRAGWCRWRWGRFLLGGWGMCVGVCGRRRMTGMSRWFAVTRFPVSARCCWVSWSRCGCRSCMHGCCCRWCRVGLGCRRGRCGTCTWCWGRHSGRRSVGD